ncbi:dephospho-CoA kinase [Fusibacter paucivorans]|uniref:Dephospho-CoA kinase n=1 Tax=Fusibacter paucivorans TaxID=76009 RepID=A0ABS5PTD6_9FIRM|nr:dephospho-CoA kinase [Fusibacter paucivorans]MBS7527312.1 dephospho-CoA kinase [Fusibacter paucivorans]
MMQSKAFIIGLTGGIASGKSTVTKYLIGKGYPVVDADLIARHIVDRGSPALAAIAKTFGETYLMADGSLDRKKLGELVFNDETARNALNQITHDRIYQAIWDEINVLKTSHHIIFADIPLLIESGRFKKYDEIWLVYVPREVQIERLMQRDSVTEQFAEAQLNSQMPLDEKKNDATRIMDNAGDKNHLFSQVDAALSDILKTLTIN